MTSKDVIAFLAWAEDNGITWDKSAVEIKEGKLGFGLYAKRHLEAEYEVVKVPKAIILSVETTGIANLLADEEIEGYTGLIMGCLYELSRGSASPWSTYLEFLLKHPAQMATSIPKDTREMLKNCEVYNDIESDIKDLQDDYDSIVVPFVEKHPEVFPKEIKAEFFSFDAYKAMAGHVSSRGMDVDHFHIMALVPFADFVNHSPMPNADFLTHEDVCEICGNLVCEHREHDDDDSEDGSTDTEGDDDDEDDTKVPDLVGADGATPSKKDTDDEEEEWEDEDQEDDEDEDEDEDEEDIDDTCDIILDTDVKKGQEITRHYGPYPNKILLSKYGFAVEDNPHDTVTIQLEMIRQAAQKFIKDEESVEERIQWFLENEDAFIGAEDGHAHGDGCCDGGDHEHGDACQQGSEDEAHDHHKHAKDGACCSNNKQKKARPHGTKEDKSDEEMEENDADDDNGDKDDSDTDDDDDDDFPRDIMYILNDGCVDDRLLMLLNVLFMEKDMFAKAKDDTDGAMEYFDEVFLRRQHEEMEEDMDEDVELKSRDAKSKKVRKAVLKAILELVRIRADAFGVSNKTTAEQDLTKLKKAKLQGTLFYGGLCVQGEKQILQRALQGSNRLLSEL